MKPGILAEAVLVGRKNELSELQSFLEFAVQGRGNTVFISGEAGVGKTRLLAEFLKIARKRKTNVLTGWCLGDVAVPYFPFVEAFDSHFSTIEDESASTFSQRMNLKSRLIATNQINAGERLSRSPQVWKDQAFAAVKEELLLLSAKRPLILALEDIHWADSASLSLLHYLARQVGSERILILATLRSEELTPTLEGHPNPLSKVLLLMGRDSLYREIKLSSLNTADVEGIARSMLRGNVNPQLVERLASDSKGNPLFVVESIRYLFQLGGLSKKNGQWNLRVEDFEIPPKVKDIILRRLDFLAPDRRKILDVASIIGEKFDPELVADVVSLDTTDVLIALNEIAKSTLLVYCEGDFYRFSHAKSREMLYKEIPQLLRKKYHSRVAEKIETSNHNELQVSVDDLAYHYVQAGKSDKAIKYSLLAGKAALARYSNVEAIRHFSYVSNTSGSNEAHFNEWISAVEGLGDAYFANGMFKEAMKMYEDIADNPKTCAVKLRVLRKAIKSSILFGDQLHARELVKKVEQYKAADRLETARILMDKALVDPSRYIDGILKDYMVALRVFEEEYSLWDVASALFVAGALRARLGKPQEGLAESLCSISLFEELGDFRSQMEACFFAGLTFNNCLLSREAFEMFAKMIEIDEKTKMSEYSRLSDANIFSSLSLSATGDFEKALPYALKALELSKKTDSLLAHGMVYSILTIIYARLSDLKRAEQYLDELVKLPQEVQNNSFVLAANAKAVISAGKSQWEQSNRYFDEFFKNLETNPAPAGLAAGKEMYAWALERQGRFNEAKAHLAQAQKMRKEAKERFEHVSVQANLIAKSKVRLGQTFEVRLDIVNVSRSVGLLLHIENLVSPKLDITVFPKGCTIRNDVIDMNKEVIQPFQVKTFKLSLQAKQQGKINLNPYVTYIDDLGKTQTIAANMVTLTIHAPETSTEEARFAKLPQIEFKFRSGDAQKAFDFLVKSFLKDYVEKKLPAERSGWRTLMDLVKNGKISKYAAYGLKGRGRRAVSELQHRGLVEARVFSGERGRGGKILKLRVAYNNEALKGRLVAKS